MPLVPSSSTIPSFYGQLPEITQFVPGTGLYWRVITNLKTSPFSSWVWRSIPARSSGCGARAECCQKKA